MTYPVAEKFVSINGEASRAGELAVFIRFRRCNLRCTYCDTRWANSDECPAEELTARQIADYVRETAVKNVTLTGGEPLLQEGLYDLIELLMAQGNSVEIETNGSIPISGLCGREYRPVFTFDYKLPYSGMEGAMVMENYEYLAPEDNVKFVAGDISDLERTAEIIGKFGLESRCHVYISPVYGKLDPAEIVGFMKERNLNNVRLQLQLHKFIWDPQERGV